MKKAQIKKTVLEVIGCIVLGVAFVSIFVLGDYLEHKDEIEEPIVNAETVAPATFENPRASRIYFDVPLDQEVQDCIFDECEKADISPALVVAIIERESNFDPEAIGDGGRSIGLMQIQVKCHLQRMADLGCEILTDPCQNVRVGINYLAELKERNSSIFWVLMAYNGGPSYANKKMADGEISEFATSVLARAYELGGDL